MNYVTAFLQSPAFGWETKKYNFNERYANFSESTEHLRNFRNAVKVAGYLPIIGVISGLAETAWGLYGALQYATAPSESAAKKVLQSPQSPTNPSIDTSQRRLDKARIAVIHTTRGVVAIAGYGWVLGAVDLCVTVARPYFFKEFKATT